ncbi:MAG: immunoglobulin domain-containing protein, partial [Chitinophagaceae bacterium]|nr:immunoglobulin domain-containing protein [Chitinophagaceae bacterium]
MQQLLSLSVYHRAIHALLTPFYFLLEPKKMLLRLAMLVLSVGMMSGVAGQATLVTDQPDYMPGTTATLTGAGFQAGESIRMQVVHADGTPATGTDHDPWFVNADADGNFTTTWHVCEDDCLGSQLLATADGQSSTIHAEVLFTDALVVSTSTGGLWSSAGTWSRVARTGSITTSNSSITVTGSGTLFLSELAIGSIITRTNGAILGTVASITSNTSLTLTGNAASTQTAITFNAQIVPFSGDDVAIASGATVTVNGIFSCASLLINDGGNATANLDFAASGSPTLTVAGAVTIGNIGNANREGTLTFANGSTLIAGSLSLGAIATQTSSINMTSGGLLKVNGSISVFSGSTWTPGSGTLELTANNTLPSTILTSFNNLTVSSGITTLGAGPTTVNGTLNVSGTLANGGNSLAGTGNIVVNSGGSFRWNNQLIPAISGTKTFDANSTFEYYRNGNQNIAIYNYGHLVLSGTANQKLLQGNTTVNGNLTVNAASDLRNTGGAGRTITMTASAPTISVLGSITGTDIGPSNDINLDYSNTTGTLTVSGNGSLCRFLNASVSNSTATLALARNFEVMFGTFTMNGTLRIDNGGSVSSAANAVAPTYGNNSFLVYNTTFNTANEWTGGNSNNPVAGLGVPANVTILSGTVSLTANRGTPGNVLISGGQLNLGSGDLYLGGNFTHNASFINNGKAVFFVGNAATQTINASGGGVSFAYLIIDKPSGVVSLQNASFFIDVNGSAGNTLQLLNAGQLDLNGGTLNLNNNGGFIYVNGARTITSASAFGKVKINASKSVANNAGVGTLLFDANVRVELFNQMDFGFSAGSISTIAGELEIKNGGFVTTARAPFYATGSTLRYNSGGNYGAGEEWYPNSFGEVTGVPFHVEIAAGTSMNFGNANTARELRGNMTLGAGTNFYLSNVAGGDLKIKGNWINNGGTFFYNGRAVFFNGTGAQTISKTGGEIFGITILTKSSGSVDLLNDLRVDQLQFETGNTANINTASNTLFVFGNASTDVVRTGNGYVNGILKRNLGATGQNYLFPVGKTAYLPLTVHASSGTGELSSEAFETSIVGAVPANTTLFPNRQWNVSQVSGGPFTYNITLDGTGFTPGTSDAVIVKGDGANPLTSFPATANGNNYTANGITGFSFFALAAACDPPIITLANQPQSQTVCENQSVSFTVTATGTGVPSYTYKWYKTGNPVALSNGGNISGATSATLTINPVATADAGSFYVEVSRPCGTFTTSSAATLTVKEVPEVTTSPVDQTVTYGAAAGFTVVANGTGITYQWQEKIGAAPFANITDGGIYSGATTATLNLSRPTVAMSGRKYRVLVSGDCSPPAESGEATLVVSALEITGNFTADNKVYDGNTSAVVLTRTLNGVLAGDVANVTLTGGTATFSDKNVGNGKTVTLTGATLSGSEAGNYSLLSVGTTTANITALEITGNFTADNKVYDGNTSAVVLTR